MPATDYDWRLSIEGSGEPLVLVCGMDGTGQLFYRQVPLLVRASYRVATYALRSDAASMETLIEDLGRVIDAVAPETRRAIVVGESFGGALVMSFALARPQQVSALVVVNSFPRFTPTLNLRLARLGLELIPWSAMSLIRRATAFRFHSPSTPRDDIRRFLRITAGASRAGYLNRLTLLLSYDVRQRLHDLRVPTLFLAADQDHLVPAVRQARFMAGRVPNATLQVLHRHGHACLIAPDVDLAAILATWRARGSERLL